MPIARIKRAFADTRQLLTVRLVSIVQAAREMSGNSDRRFNAAMKFIAVIIVAIIITVLILQHSCQEPLVLINFTGVMFLIFSIPVSMIGERGKWQWPVLLASAGLVLWWMSLVLGPLAWGELPKFLRQILDPPCG